MLLYQFIEVLQNTQVPTYIINSQLRTVLFIQIDKEQNDSIVIHSLCLKVGLLLNHPGYYGLPLSWSNLF